MDELRSPIEPAAARARRPAAPAAIAILVIVVVIAASARRDPVSAAPPATTPGAAGPAADAGRSDAPPAAAPAPDRVAALAPLSPARAAPPGSESIALCGGDWAPVDAAGDVDASMLFRLPTVVEGRARTLETLRSSAGEIGRAAALLLDLEAIAARADTLASAARCIDARCAATASAEAWAETLDRLAHAAVTTRDPQVYALALSACQGRDVEGGECARLSPEQWARLDPGNARPWMHALHRAIARGDKAARDEALYRVATSERDDSRLHILAALVIDAAGTDDRVQLAATLLAAHAIGMEAAWPEPHFQDLLRTCRVSLEADPNLWQTCSSAAERLAERSDSLVARDVGLGLARRLGWPTARTDRLAGELAEARSASQGSTGPATDRRLGSCADLRRDLQRLRLQASLGDVAGLRAWLGAAPADPQTLERRGREERERTEARQPSAAPAGAPPASASASAAEPGSAPAPDRAPAPEAARFGTGDGTS